MSKAVLYIAVAALSFGLIAPISALVESLNVDVKLVATLGFVFSTMAFAASAVLKGYGVNSSCRISFGNTSLRFMFALRVIAGLNLFLLAWAFSKIEARLFGVVLTEIYPILAIIFASIFFKKEPITRRSSVLIGLAMLGVALTPLYEIITSKQTIPTSDVKYLCIIFIAALFSAVSAVIEPEISSHIVQNSQIPHADAAIVSKFTTNLMTSVFVIGLYLITTNQDPQITLPVIGLALLFGLCVDVIPGFLSRLAGPLITNNGVYALWSLAPILGSFLLVIFFDTEMSVPMLLSGVLVVVSNILLVLHQR